MSWRVAHGAAWSIAGAAVSRGLTLVGSVVVARILGKENFGQLGVIQSTVGMFGVFAGFGLGLTATKYVAEYRTQDPEKTARIVVLTEIVTVAASIVVCLALLGSAGFLSSHTLGAPGLKHLLVLGVIIIPFNALNGLQVGALSGLECFRTIAKVNFWSGLLSFPVVVGTACLWGTAGAVLGLSATVAINCAISHASLLRECARFGIKLKVTGCAQELRILWHFSLPTVLSSAVSVCSNWICTAMLVNQTNGFAEMGVVSAGNQWRSALTFLPMLLVNATLPMMANENSKDDGCSAKVIGISHKLLVMSVLPLTILIMLSAGGVMGFYGRGFAQGRSALVCLLAGAAIATVSSPAGSFIISRGWMWLAFVITMVHALVFTGLTRLLIPSHGATGLAAAYMIASFTQAFFSYWYLRKELPAGSFLHISLAMAFILALAFTIGPINS